jgi:hypothetical protein
LGLTLLLAAIAPAALATADQSQLQPEAPASASAEPPAGEPQSPDADAPPRPKPEVRERNLGPRARRVINPDGTSTIVEETFPTAPRAQPRLEGDRDGTTEPTGETKAEPPANESRPPLERAKFASDTPQQAPRTDLTDGFLESPIVLVLAGAVVILLLVLMVAFRGGAQRPPTKPE